MKNGTSFVISLHRESCFRLCIWDGTMCRNIKRARNGFVLLIFFLTSWMLDLPQFHGRFVIFRQKFCSKSQKKLQVLLMKSPKTLTWVRAFENPYQKSYVQQHTLIHRPWMYMIFVVVLVCFHLTNRRKIYRI